jgi:hypothetical protein
MPAGMNGLLIPPRSTKPMGRPGNAAMRCSALVWRATASV